MKRKMLFVPSVLLTLGLASCTVKEQSAQATQATQATESSPFTYPTVTVQELRAAVDSGAYVLDVRTPEEFAEGHIEQATNLPLDQVQARAAEVPDDRPVYVICRSGNRSAQASEILKKAGKDVKNVGGGMSDWLSAGYPTTR